VYRKNYGWSVGLVYDSRQLGEVTTARPRVAGVLPMVLELALKVRQTRTDQLRRIR
jgi:hypothetical protein